MPTYEYVCEGCRHEFEEFQSITAPPLRKCPRCARPRLRRLIGSGAGIIFKGSGFYETDYRRKTGTPPKEEGEAKAAESKTESKAETKSGTKSETKAGKKSETPKGDGKK
ncbi:MAG: zinc ribbon domain-containing protein [Planctomycetes bacterium]|nr:zinc ribbon domain-containing protein [Planctomycetota bacterium]